MFDFKQVNGSIDVLLKIMSFVLAFFGLINLNLIFIFPIITIYIIKRNLVNGFHTLAIFFAFAFQWLQVSIKPIYSLVQGEDLKSLTDFPDYIHEAYFYSSLALIIISFAIGKHLKKLKFEEFKIDDKINVLNAQLAYVGFIILSLVFEKTLGRLGGVKQFYITFSAFKWMFFALVYLLVRNKKEGYGILYIIIFLEFINGFFSYFSDFKSVIFATLICEAFFLKKEKIPKLAFVGVVLLYLSLYWTAVKGDYREYISDGGGQVVVVQKNDAYSYLIDLVKSVDEERWERAKISLLDRISYIDYFSSVIAYVPNNLPHEYGKISWNAIEFVIMPRIFFPNKPVINESIELTKYSGVYYSDNSKGTSYSIGYVGDLYIDYSFFGMFFACFVFGHAIGYLLTKMINRYKTTFWIFCFSVLFFNLFFKFEISLVKLVGQFMMFFLVNYLFTRFVFDKFASFFIKVK